MFPCRPTHVDMSLWSLCRRGINDDVSTMRVCVAPTSSLCKRLRLRHSATYWFHGCFNYRVFQPSILCCHQPNIQDRQKSITSKYCQWTWLIYIVVGERMSDLCYASFTVKWVPAYELSNNNKWRWCLRIVAANLSADSQPKSVGLVWGLAATRRSVCIHHGTLRSGARFSKNLRTNLEKT